MVHQTSAHGRARKRTFGAGFDMMAPTSVAGRPAACPACRMRDDAGSGLRMEEDAAPPAWDGPTFDAS